MTAQTPPQPAARPVALRDHRPRRARLAAAVVLLLACLAISGFVQSLRDTGMARYGQSAPVSQGLGAALDDATPNQPKSHWLVFFGISSGLVLLGCGIAYATSDPLERRALDVRRAADAARARRDRLRGETVDQRRTTVLLDKRIAETVVNATRDIWVAEGWGEADILGRVVANPQLFGAWSAPADRVLRTPHPPPPGDALGAGVGAERPGNADAPADDAASPHAPVDVTALLATAERVEHVPSRNGDSA